MYLIFQKVNKSLILTICLSFFLLNCEKEQSDLMSQPSLSISGPLKIEKLSKKDISDDLLFREVVSRFGIERIVDLENIDKPNLKFSNISTELGFIVQTDLIKKIKTDSVISYTMLIKRISKTKDESKFENLVIEKRGDSLRGYFMKYKFENKFLKNRKKDSLAGTINITDYAGNINNLIDKVNSQESSNILKYMNEDCESATIYVEVACPCVGHWPGENCQCNYQPYTAQLIVENCTGGDTVFDDGDTYYSSGEPNGGNGSGNGPVSATVIPDEELETIEKIINNQLIADPFKLVEIECAQLPHWQSLAIHSPPNSVLGKLNIIDQSNFGNFEVQKIDDAEGAVVNLDYFPVAIDVLPNNPVTGQQFTADQFLEHIRTNINNFVDPAYSQFYPSSITGYDEENIWLSNNPLGAIISIDITGGHDGSVVCSEYDSSSHWRFTTLETPWDVQLGADGAHPVSGNRQFGYIQNSNGSYTFYTRGVDRFESNIDVIAADFILDGQPFSGADNLWTSFQYKIQNFANTNGGLGNVMPQVINRPDWVKVKDVLLGNRPVSDLGCD